jgi:hypothetical protein
VRSVVELLGSVRGEAPPVEGSGSTDPEPGDDGTPSLFQCPDCRRVYVAVDKEACGSCKTPVERVPSTFDEV